MNTESSNKKIVLQQLRNNGNLIYGNIADTGVKGCLKKLIRKIISFLIIPVVQQQNRFNAAAADKVEELTADLQMMEERIGKGDYSQLVSFFERRDEMFDAMENRILQLEKRISELESENGEHA